MARYFDREELTAPSIDAASVAYFQNRADLWWDQDGIFWPLHVLNQVRVKWILEQLDVNPDSAQHPLQGRRVLDIGCGGGILSESLAALGASVTGIDVVEENIRTAQLHSRTSGLNIDYRVASVESLSGNIDEKFDIVFNMEVIEHVADFRSFLLTCNTFVKPGGHLFIATINRNFLSWLVAIIGAEYILGWLPKGTHKYAMLRKPSELITLLQRDKFIVRNTAGVAVNPLTRNMSIVKNTWVNYMIHSLKTS